jgi:putative transposase
MYARGMTTRDRVSGCADGEGARRRPRAEQGHLRGAGVNLEGQKEVLGLGVAQTEGAKFWLQVLTELQNRGVKDIFIACVDGLKGFPQAIEAVYPRTEAQLCIVHLVRASLNYVPWKQRKPVAADLQLIYPAATAIEAEQQLAELEAKWTTYPGVGQVWRRNWTRIRPFFKYPADIRKAIYTTNRVESLNRSLRKIIKIRGGFPNEEAALKLLFLALRQAAKKWTTPIHHWRKALNDFTILWPDRMPAMERVAS